MNEQACQGYISIGAAIGGPLMILCLFVGFACLYVGAAYANKLQAQAFALRKGRE